MSKKAKWEKWFESSKHTGWEKSMPAEKRRSLVLKAHKGDLLASARSMQALSNVTKDSTTKQRARADAKYFFDMYKRSKGR